MKRHLLTIASLLLSSAALFAQEPKLEDDGQSSPPPAVEETAPLKAETLADRWRTEVLGWTSATRIEAGAESASIKELSRSVLVLGTVKGDVSTVSGDIAVLGTVEGNVSAVSGTITVLGTVKGKASVVGGNLRVAGNVLSGTSVVGGKLETAPKDVPPVEKTEPVPAVASATSTNTATTSSSSQFDFNFDGGHFRMNMKDGNYHWDGDGLEGLFNAFWLSPFMLVWRSGMLIVWVALSGVLAALCQPAILRAQAELEAAPARTAALGLLWMISYWVLLILSIILCLLLIGIPMLLVVLGLDLALGIFGRTVTFSLIGRWLAQRFGHANASIFATVFAGACLVGLLRLIPVLGSVIWFAVSMVGIGAALATRFGQVPVTTGGNTPASLPPLAAV